MRETDLILSRGGFPPLSARGCHQTLEPIARGDLKRTIKGELVYLGRSTHHKYQSVIACEDKEAPALEHLWKGQEIHVACIQRLWHKANESYVVLERPPRPDSVIVLQQGKSISPTTINGQKVELPSWEDTIVGYQPILKMMLVDFTIKYHEWRQAGGWTLTLVEV